MPKHKETPIFCARIKPQFLKVPEVEGSAALRLAPRLVPRKHGDRFMQAPASFPSQQQICLFVPLGVGLDLVKDDGSFLFNTSSHWRPRSDTKPSHSMCGSSSCSYRAVLQKNSVDAF